LITYARETFDQAVNDVKDVLHQQWMEMALYKDSIPLDPDWNTYRHAFESGFMTIFTARDHGTLVGYIIFHLTMRHLHYKHRFAKDDTIWFKPEYRGAGIATGLFDYFEADLNGAGPVVIVIESREGHPALDQLCYSRGYSHMGAIFGKRLKGTAAESIN
jgi:ribosomal protein S18 acetylase RimI-like enzyme